MAYISNELTKVTLASNDAYWVQIDPNITWATMKKIKQVDGDGNSSYQVDAMLIALIKDWNLDDADGNTIPVTPENIDLLKKPDLEKIVETIGGKIEEPAETKKAS